MSIKEVVESFGSNDMCQAPCSSGQATSKKRDSHSESLFSSYLQVSADY